jgi:hypothetical protein
MISKFKSFFDKAEFYQLWKQSQQKNYSACRGSIVLLDKVMPREMK